MKNNMLVKIIQSVFWGLSLFLFVFPQVSLAADCKTLRHEIKNERSLIKRRGIIEEALKQCPNDPVITFEYGYNFERFRKYDEARKYYREAIKLDRRYAKPYFGLADMAAADGDYKSAIDYYEKGLKFDSDNPRAMAALKETRETYRKKTGKTVTPVATQTAKVTPDISISIIEAPILRLNIPFSGKTSTLGQDAKDVLGVVVGQAMSRDSLRANIYGIEGHTDNTGNADSNKALSEKRAAKVKDYLTGNFNIASDRLQVAGHGQDNPKMPNTSIENQVANRRVEFSKIR